eukprot:gene10009-11032_t
MANFNAKAFDRKLKDMDLSQTSIQSVSLWIIHHKQQIKEILSVWIDQIKKVKPDRKMALFYLANDVVQNCRKKSRELIMFFAKAFKEILPYLSDRKINGQVERVIKIWEERRVYEKEHIDKFRSLHSSGRKDEKKEKSTKTIEKPTEKSVRLKSLSRPLPPDFKMSTVMNMVVSMKELESEIRKQQNQMATLRVDASDLEAVKQVKDRSGVNKFVKEFEESKEKLDLHCNTMSRCINEKRSLIDMLYHSDSYYDAAYEEAKVIVHAYKKFGNRLSSMKRKVESRVRKLEIAWRKKQKEIQEKKASLPEYEVEPISDAEEPNEFEAIGDLVQSGLDSLSKRKKARDKLHEHEDPTLDNVNVLDMDIESDSDADTPPTGPLYDPSSVLYDPTEIGDAVNGDSSAQINIPNPEDVFKNLVGHSDSVDASGDGTSAMATEPSGTLISDAAMSPISEDSCPTPEGTPDGLVIDDTAVVDDTAPSVSMFMMQNNTNVTSALPSTPLLHLGGGQMAVGGQVSEAWPNVSLVQPFQLEQLQQPGSNADWATLSGNLQLHDISPRGLLPPLGLAMSSTDGLLNQGLVQCNDGMMQPGLPMQQQQGLLLDSTAALGSVTTNEESGKRSRSADKKRDESKSRHRKHKLSGSPDGSKRHERSHSRSSKKKKSSHRHRHHSGESKHGESSQEQHGDSPSSHGSSTRGKDKQSRVGEKSARRKSRSHSHASLDDSIMLPPEKSPLRRDHSVGSYSNDTFEGAVMLNGPNSSARLNISNEPVETASGLAKDKGGGFETLQFDSTNIGNSSKDFESRQLTVFDLRRNASKPADNNAIDNVNRKDISKSGTDVQASFFSQNPVQSSSAVNQFSSSHAMNTGVALITTSSQPALINYPEQSTLPSTSNTEQQATGYFYDARRSPTPEMDQFEQPLLDNNNFPQPQFGEIQISQTNQLESASLPVPQFAFDFEQNMQQGLLPLPISNPGFQPQVIEQHQPQIMSTLQSPPAQHEPSLLGQYQPPVQAGALMLTAAQPSDGILPIVEQQPILSERQQFHSGQQMFIPEQDQAVFNQQEAPQSLSQPQSLENEFQSNASDFNSENSFIHPERSFLAQNEPMFHENRARPRQERQNFHPPDGPLLRGPRPMFQHQGPRFQDEVQHGGQHQEQEMFNPRPRFKKQSSHDSPHHQRGNFDDRLPINNNMNRDMHHVERDTSRNSDMMNHHPRHHNYNDNHDMNGIVNQSPRGNPNHPQHKPRHSRPGQYQHRFPPRGGGPKNRGGGGGRFRNQEPNNFHPRSNRMPMMGGHPGHHGGPRPRFRPPQRPRFPQGTPPRRPPVF